MTAEPLPSPSRPSRAAVIAFVLAAALLPCFICGSQFFIWLVEQLAIASASAGNLAALGKTGLVGQAIILLVVSSSFYALSRNALRPIYQGWLIASLFAFPALALRFLGPHQDQIGSLIQIGLTAAAVVFLFRRRSLALNPRQALSV